jgi:hypothetical protein
MSIDALVSSIDLTIGNPKLVLVDRPSGGPAGQGSLEILNPPADIEELRPFLLCELWGGCGEIMLGDDRIAIRQGYTSITLVDGWRDILAKYQEALA